jgi:8-oxo-dGTP pyrophosphatase MutT (NUDIX family)
MRQKTMIGVIGLAVNQDYQFLLTQRNQPDTPAWHLKWNIPGGGLEFGEDPITGLEREFWEELRVKPTLIHPQPIPVNIVWYAKDTGYDHDFHLILLCYLVDIGKQKIDLTHDPEEETCAYQWFSLDELDALETLPQTKETVRTVLRLVA